MIGLILTILFVPLYNFAAIEIGVTVSAHQILAAITILIVMVRLFYKKEYKKDPIKTASDKVLLIFVFVVSISSLIMLPQLPIDAGSRIYGGIFRNTGLRSIIQLIHLYFLVGIYFAVIYIVKNKKILYASINALFFIIFISSLIAVYQLLSYSLHLPSIPGMAHIYRPGFGFSQPPAEYLGIVRASAFGAEPKALAGIFFPAIILIFSFKTLRENPWRKKPILIVLLMSLVVYILSGSRSQWIILLTCMVLLTPVFFWLSRRYLKYKPSFSRGLFAFSFAVTIYYVLSSSLGYSPWLWVSERFLSTAMPFAGEHEDSLKAITALHLFGKYPFLGIGFGNFSFYYYSTEYAENVPGMFLGLLAETGMVGFILMLWFLISTTKYIIQSLKVVSDISLKETILGLFICYLGFIISCILYRGLFDYYFWILLGMLKASIRLGLRDKKDNLEHGIAGTFVK
jgi:hypothetical protein